MDVGLYHLSKELYPSMVEYIIFYSSRFDSMPCKIKCCSEFVDEDDTLYWAHHNFCRSGSWHNWAMAAYANDSEDGFSNVPVKLLCFLPEGIPGNSECHAVCHACQWQERQETSILTKWNLVPCVAAIANGIPYDVCLHHCWYVRHLLSQILVLQELYTRSFQIVSGVINSLFNLVKNKNKKI